MSAEEQGVLEPVVSAVVATAESPAVEEELSEESPATLWITVGMFGLLVVLSSGCLAIQFLF